VRVAISPAAEHGMVRLCHIAAAMSQLPEIMGNITVSGWVALAVGVCVRPAVLALRLLSCTSERN
jgi:hypothetical protein